MPDRRIKISIIVPVCNAGKYLKEALDSVFKQSFTVWELILVDNMSKDNSLSICESYAQTDDRVCVYKEEKNGAGAARNTGMKMARGEYLFFWMRMTAWRERISCKTGGADGAAAGGYCCL